MSYKAQRDARRTPERFTLPSGYWVEMKGSLTIGEAEEAIPADLTAANRGTAYAVTSMIVAWNLDDDAGNVLPITVENVRELDDADAATLLEYLAACKSTDTKAREAFLSKRSVGPTASAEPQPV